MLRLFSGRGTAARVSETLGQASVEAALLIPIALVGILIAVQPAIALYDRIVMEVAAAEGCRVLETLPEGQDDRAVEYVRRRLDAVPVVPAFHKGEWEIEVSGAGQQSELVSVRIAHDFEPLPLMGAAMGLSGIFGRGNAAHQEVFRQQRVHDEWALHSDFGLQFEAWVQRWEGKA